jgi:hypothetical protein
MTLADLNRLFHLFAIYGYLTACNLDYKEANYFMFADNELEVMWKEKIVE